ncbi:hypothetical protein ACFO4O_07380 [Glaciecola siphonariae]|uniref:Lipoprotein n=1 Tax=Glaciecola siphonariae TaxID=521012 RepID=A0ABV9LTX9_9ALTE
MKTIYQKIKNILHITLIIGIFSLMTGCASKSLEAQKANNVDLTALKTMYVEKLPADERGIEILIATELNKLGYQATYGPKFPADGDFDALVTYQDKWMWDITMYMLELNIQVKNPDTNFIMASGHSHRTSLVRKSKEEMVSEVVGEIFK